MLFKNKKYKNDALKTLLRKQVAKDLKLFLQGRKN